MSFVVEDLELHAFSKLFIIVVVVLFVFAVCEADSDFDITFLLW